MSHLESKAFYDKFKGATSSTPNAFSVYSRKPIHENSEAATPSPIGKTAASRENINVTPDERHERRSSFHSSRFPESTESERSSSYVNDTSLSNSSSPKRASPEKDRNAKPKLLVLEKSDKDTDGSKQELSKQNIMLSLGCLIAFISGMIFLAFSSNSEATDLLLNNKITIEDLQSNFPLQSEEMWSALQTGIDEVRNLNKPSVFLFLYEEKAENTVNNILSNASKYAECVLRNCEIQPITLTSGSLNTEKAIADYGYIISKYKPELEQRTVMIVKELDKVSGEVAQAFHSMCDEYTPLVEKTVFFFTMKIGNLNDLQDSNVHVAEEILRSNWSNLDEDVFEPLFTRISSIVLRIVPENM